MNRSSHTRTSPPSRILTLLLVLAFAITFVAAVTSGLITYIAGAGVIGVVLVVGTPLALVPPRPRPTYDDSPVART
jgi:hypothetical protein